MTLPTSCEERLERYFSDEDVPFLLTQHGVAYCAQEVAASEHVRGQPPADVVLATANGRMVMLVLSAAHLVRLGRLAEALGASDSRQVYARLMQAGERSSATLDIASLPPRANGHQRPPLPTAGDVETVCWE